VVVYLIFLTIGFAFMAALFFWQQSQLRLRLKSISEQTESNNNTLHRLIHDIKSPIATAAMALHNLSFVLNEPKEKKSIPEFFSSAQEAITDINNRLLEAVTFSRTDTTNFQPVDLAGLVENISSSADTTVKIIPDLDNQIPLVQADQQALSLVFNKLILLSKSERNNLQIIHIKLENITSEYRQIVCKIYHHTYLSVSTIEYEQLQFLPDRMKNGNHLLFSIVQQILSRHNAILFGTFDKQKGGFWTFNLRGMKE